MLRKIRAALEDSLPFAVAGTSHVVHLARHPALYARYRRSLAAAACALRGKRVLVLGNGPSLREMLEALAEHAKTSANGLSFWSVNNFVLTPEFERLKPNDHLLLDPTYWQPEVNVQFAGIPDKVREVLKRATWPIRIWIPMEAAKTPEWRRFEKEAPETISIIYASTREYSAHYPGANWLYARSWLCPRLQNVVGGAVFYAIRAGVREIGVAGADHSWTRDLFVGDDNLVRYCDRPFNAPDAKAKLWPKLDGKGYNTLGEVLGFLSKTLCCHEHIQSFAVSQGCKIANLTPGSFIDAYPRETLLAWLRSSSPTAQPVRT